MSEIPTKESNIKGTPVTDVLSAQQELLRQMETPKEQPSDVEENTETEDMVSEQAMDVAESVENEAAEDLAAEQVEDGTEEEIETPNTYSIKVDGQEVEVTLDELKKGYSRQADYTRKSQVVAEQKQRVEQELAATQQERQRYISQLEQITTQAESEIKKFEKLDWEKLKEEDPMNYMVKRDTFNELKENAKKIEEEKKSLAIQQQKEYAEKMQDTIKQQQEIIKTKLPEWEDSDKGPKLKQAIKSYAVSQGFTEEEVNSLVDARSVVILHKAMLHDNIINSKIAKKKAKVVPKVTKPGTGTTKGEVASEKNAKLRAKVRKSGKVTDAAKYLEGLI